MRYTTINGQRKTVEKQSHCQSKETAQEYCRWGKEIMYSYNSTKHNYLQVGDSLEVYKVSTKLPIEYKGPDVQSDSEKEFVHMKQLFGIYGKILFFTAPKKRHIRCNLWNRLFAQNGDAVGVLKKRLDNWLCLQILFGTRRILILG